jgi:branched-chain amino acid aminotransferase
MIDLICWHNDCYKKIDEVRISPLDFGFIHSDATYDVMRIKDNTILFYDYHEQRFADSCKYFNFTFDFNIKEIADELLKKNNIDDAFLWTICWRGTPPSGYPRDLTAPQHSMVYIKKHYGISDTGVSLYIDEINRRVPDQCYDQKHKNFGWIEFTLAQRRAAADGYDSVLLLSIDDYITEGMGFGVCFSKNGTIYTPAKDCLDSITIKSVEAVCNELSIPFIRTNISKEDALNFDECFICSTSGGLTIVKKINEKHYTHTISLKIKEYYDQKNNI